MKALAQLGQSARRCGRGSIFQQVARLAAEMAADRRQRYEPQALDLALLE
jgi:hypothetical protein